VLGPVGPEFFSYADQDNIMWSQVFEIPDDR
jgi:hypothetical protein